VRDGFKAFDAECQEAVESQYRAFSAGGPQVGSVTAGGKTVLIDFKTMKQHLEGSNRQRDVRRTIMPC